MNVSRATSGRYLAKRVHSGGIRERVVMLLRRLWLGCGWSGLTARVRRRGEKRRPKCPGGQSSGHRVPIKRPYRSIKKSMVLPGWANRRSLYSSSVANKCSPSPSNSIVRPRSFEELSQFRIFGATGPSPQQAIQEEFTKLPNRANAAWRTIDSTLEKENPLRAKRRSGGS